MLRTVVEESGVIIAFSSSACLSSALQEHLWTLILSLRPPPPSTDPLHLHVLLWWSMWNDSPPMTRATAAFISWPLHGSQFPATSPGVVSYLFIYSSDSAVIIVVPFHSSISTPHTYIHTHTCNSEKALVIIIVINIFGWMLNFQ